MRRLAGLASLLAFPAAFRGLCIASPDNNQDDGRGTGRKGIGDYFAGEELEYDVGFWFMKRVATAKMSFFRLDGKGRFAATLRGETVGLAGWLTRYRVDRYRAVMEEVDRGRRLRPVSFEEYVSLGSKVRKNIHRFDHEKRLWVHETSRRNGTTRTVTHAIPEGKTYDDFVTASYNFRYHAYGAVEKGRTYTVPTFPRKGATSYHVRIAPKEEEEVRRKAEPLAPDSAFFITLRLDPEVVNSKEGIIEGWLSNDLYPVEGTIRDAVLYGDVKGRLTRRRPPGVDGSHFS